MRPKTITDDVVFVCDRCKIGFNSKLTKSLWMSEARKLGWRFFQDKPVCPQCLTDNERYSGFKPGKFSKTAFARLLDKKPQLYPEQLSNCPGERYGYWLYEFRKDYFNDSYYHYCKQRLKQ